jgi:beta-glucosidase
MGLEWARIEPQPGQFDPSAIEHYRHELTALRAAGIEPLVTLHHFNNPGWLEERDAWLADDVVAIFLRYVRHVVAQLGDLVDGWVTINEPNVYVTQGHVFGDWPPGNRSISQAMTVMSRLAQAHIRAYQLIHALQPTARVGVAHHLRVFGVAQPWNPLQLLSRSVMRYLFQDAVMEAMAYGRFRAPLRAGRSNKRGRYFDFTGINYYTRSWVDGFWPSTRPGASVNDLGWEIYPAGLTALIDAVAKRYPGPIYITENGTADATDSFRRRYIYDHLAAVAAAVAPVERYYHWCFTDNWEWIEGEVPRFGLVELNYDSQRRTIKNSGRMFADIIAHGGVTDEAYERWVAPSARAAGIAPGRSKGQEGFTFGG